MAILLADGYKFEPKPYTLFYAAKDKLNVAVYEKGPKVVLQGKGTQDFVTFRLEPEVLGEAKLGYEEVHNPEMFAPHFGIDESGKGDFFGPLVIAGCYTDRGNPRKKLMEAGIQDSKRIGSDKRIRELAAIIKRTQGAVTASSPSAPSALQPALRQVLQPQPVCSPGATRGVIENLLEEIRGDCPRALSDQFGNPALIKRALPGKKADSFSSTSAPKRKATSPWRRHPFWRARLLSIGCTRRARRCR